MKAREQEKGEVYWGFNKKTKVIETWTNNYEEVYYVDWTGTSVERINHDFPCKLYPEKMPEFPINALWWNALTDAQQEITNERTLAKIYRESGIAFTPNLPVKHKKKIVRKPYKKAQAKKLARGSYNRIVDLLDLTEEEKKNWLKRGKS